MAKIVITGATGTIGQEVAKALLAKKADVRVLVRDPNKAGDLKALGAEVVAGDLDNPASLEEALRGAASLFLLTGFIENCVPQVKNAVEAANKAGVQFILRMSAAGADPSSPAALARHHGESEELVKASGLRWAVIRPGFFMDNLLNYTGGSLQRDGAFYGAAKDGKTAYISSRDVGESAAAILSNPDKHAGAVYTLTGGEALSESDVASLVGQVSGREIKYVDLSSDDLRKGVLSSGAPDWVADALAGLEGVKANGWASGTTNVVEELTGRPPETFRAFLERNKARLSA